MTWALLLGVGVGVGVLLLGWAVVPPRTDLVAAVGRWEAQRAHKPSTNMGQARSWRDRLPLCQAEVRHPDRCGVTF